jgi:putative Holliday junction resolvase
MSPATPERIDSPEILLGIDFGLRRIGLAVGDTLTRSARPCAALTLAHPGALGESDWKTLLSLIADRGVRRLVVGCPYNVDGSEHALAATVRSFAAGLGDRCGLPIEWVDERYSSLEAEERLREQRASGTRRRIQRAEIDSAAAAVILERWLDGAG